MAIATPLAEGSEGGDAEGKGAPGTAGNGGQGWVERQLLIQELLRDAHELDASGLTDLALQRAKNALSARSSRQSTRGCSRPSSAAHSRQRTRDGEEGTQREQHRPSSARPRVKEDFDRSGVRWAGGTMPASDGQTRHTYQPRNPSTDGEGEPARRRPQSAAAWAGSRRSTAAPGWLEAAASGVPWKHAIARPLQPSRHFLTPPRTAPTPKHPRGQQQRPRTATARQHPTLRTREMVFSQRATARPASGGDRGPPRLEKAEHCIRRSDVLSRDQHRLSFGVAPEQWRVPPTAEGAAEGDGGEAEGQAMSLDLDSSVLSVGFGPRSFDLMTRTRDGLGGTRGSMAGGGLSGCKTASRPRTDLFLVREAVRHHRRLPCNSLVHIDDKTGLVTIQRVPSAPMVWRPKPDGKDSQEHLTRQHKLQIPERTKPRKHDRRILHPGGFYEYLEGERQIIKTPPKAKPSRQEAIKLAVGDRVELPQSGETIGW